MTYSDKLKDPRWQKRRLSILERDGWACTKCKNDKISLHVHHKEYIKGLNPWEYEDNLLHTLCEVCHKKEHTVIIDIDSILPNKEESDFVKSINNQISALNDKLKDKSISIDLITEIHKNILFLKTEKSRYLTNW